MTTAETKRLVAEYLRANRLNYTSLRAKTVDFTDLARASAIFLTIEGLIASYEELAELNRYAKSIGCFIQKG